MNVTNPVAGLVNTGFNGRSDNANGSLSYNIALSGNSFIEPTANPSYTLSGFDTLAVQTGTLSFDPVQSLLLRAGARFGTSFQYGGFNWSPFGVALVLNEFSKSATGAYTSQNQVLQSVCGLGSTRVGTFYQTGAGLSFRSQTSSLMGFVRTDLRFGQKIDGAALLAGIRYSFGP